MPRLAWATASDGASFTARRKQSRAFWAACSSCLAPVLSAQELRRVRLQPDGRSHTVPTPPVACPANQGSGARLTDSGVGAALCGPLEAGNGTVQIALRLERKPQVVQGRGGVWLDPPALFDTLASAPSTSSAADSASLCTYGRGRCSEVTARASPQRLAAVFPRAVRPLPWRRAPQSQAAATGADRSAPRGPASPHPQVLTLRS